jgi:hypothetical protein
VPDDSGISEWSHTAAIEQQSVATTVKAFGAGKITIPAPPSKARNVRYAPSFSVCQGTNPSANAKAYNPGTVAKFLGIDPWKVDAALDALALIERTPSDSRRHRHRVAPVRRGPHHHERTRKHVLEQEAG